MFFLLSDFIWHLIWTFFSFPVNLIISHVIISHVHFLVGDVYQTLKLVSCNKLQLLQTKQIKTKQIKSNGGKTLLMRVLMSWVRHLPHTEGIHAFCLDDYEDMLMTLITNLTELNGHPIGIDL